MASKHIYSSEACATRAMIKYDDIKRVYKCDYCNKWHTTSMDINEYNGELENESKVSEDEIMDLISLRIKELKNK